MIAPDAEPIANRSPYKPVDVSGRKPPRPATDETPAPVPPSWWIPIEDLYGAP